MDGVSSRNFSTFCAVMPGHPMMWLFQIALRRVDLDRLCRAACRYCTRVFVCCFMVVMIFNCYVGYLLGQTFDIIFWSGIGIFQSPSLLLRFPFRTSSKFLRTCKYFLSNRMKEPSSAKCPSDNKDWFVRHGITYVGLLCWWSERRDIKFGRFTWW